MRGQALELGVLLQGGVQGGRGGILGVPSPREGSASSFGEQQESEEGETRQESPKKEENEGAKGVLKRKKK